MTMTDPSQPDAEIGFRLVDGVMYMQMAPARQRQVAQDGPQRQELAAGRRQSDGPDGPGRRSGGDAGLHRRRRTSAGRTSTARPCSYTTKVRSKAFMDLQGDLGTTGGAKAAEPDHLTSWTDDAGMMRKTELGHGRPRQRHGRDVRLGLSRRHLRPPDSDIMDMPGADMMGSSMTYRAARSWTSAGSGRAGLARRRGTYCGDSTGKGLRCSPLAAATPSLPRSRPCSPPDSSPVAPTTAPPRRPTTLVGGAGLGAGARRQSTPTSS